MLFDTGTSNLWSCSDPNRSSGAFRQARAGPKGKVRSYFFPSCSFQCLIRYFVSEEAFIVESARKLHHVASPVVENCTCRRLRNDLCYSRKCLTSGSRHCEDRSGINSDGESARIQFVALLAHADEVIE